VEFRQPPAEEKKVYRNIRSVISLWASEADVWKYCSTRGVLGKAVQSSLPDLVERFAIPRTNLVFPTINNFVSHKRIHQKCKMTICRPVLCAIELKTVKLGRRKRRGTLGVLSRARNSAIRSTWRSLAHRLAPAAGVARHIDLTEIGHNRRSCVIQS
jgi:hypothetical protein